jgi:hypothetical protein
MSSIGSIRLSVPSNLVQDDIGMAVLSKSKDQAVQQGQQLVQMLQQSVQPNLGGQLDIKV